MRIVIDMQGAQTESRFRGIGRYTLAFSLAIARNRGKNEVILALNGIFQESINTIRAAFEGVLPQENIRIWNAPGPVRDDSDENQNRREVAQLIREEFLLSLRPDIIHVCSLFEGYGDDAVTSIGLFDKKTKISVTVFDFIPLLHSDQYLLPNQSYKSHYFRKIDSLRKAALFLAISESSKEEALTNMNLREAVVLNASLGADAIFQVREINTLDAKSLQEKIGITRPFVLYTGGADERKNLKRLIEAWSLLPTELRQHHQLLFAGRMPSGLMLELRDAAKTYGLASDELLFSGYVDDEELVKLYNLCKLFVFPSLHEGFGLPPLEAMACGAAVIGSNSTSIPEVIGLEAALFDASDVMDIQRKISEVLVDENFLKSLRQHGLIQSKKFTWDRSAECAMKAWQDELNKKDSQPEYPYTRVDLLSSIAPFLGAAKNEELLRLATQIAENRAAGDERQLFLDISELCKNDAATGVQRVVRSYLLHLLNNPPPGFRVEPVYAVIGENYRYAYSYSANVLGRPAPIEQDPLLRWQRGDIFFGLDMQHHVQLEQADFYSQLRRNGVVVKFLVYDLLPIQLADLFQANELKILHEQWLEMIASQDMAICISKATANAYKNWIKEKNILCNPALVIDWVHMGADIDGSLPSKGIPKDAQSVLQKLKTRPTFLSVSTLEPRKGQAQILDAVEKLWAEGEDVNLVFVGQLGWKVESLASRLKCHSQNGQRLFWLKGISDEYLDQIYACSTCLVAASLNEGFGLPLIEAARHGISIVARDIPIFREVAGENAHYFEGLTGDHLASSLKIWLRDHKNDDFPKSTAIEWLSWSDSTAVLKNKLVHENYKRKQLLVDVSELVQHDARTGIQRVVRAILGEWLRNPPEDYRIEPVYATSNQGYRYARIFTSKFTGQSDRNLVDEVIDYSPGDIFFSLDLNHHIPRIHQSYLEKLYASGVDVRFMVYDLLPIQFPQFWDQKNSIYEIVEDWMLAIASFGGVVCISRTVAEDMEEWINKKAIRRSRSFKIDWFHLGADVHHSLPSRGLPHNANKVLELLRSRISFLMVGTLEPRKGHREVLDAFEQLWDADVDVNLVIVGKEGWMVDTFVKRLRAHSRLNKKLFWLDEASDEYLEEIYNSSACLIAASYGEGFGLPLIEAAQHNLPIIARDIKIFREVAGDHAFYFGREGSENLMKSLEAWLDLYWAKKHVFANKMPWMTWKESAGKLLEIVKNVG
ncbi:glycosyltransferase family 4 protein [Delftia sp. RIT313]|uniref:glycosyltransferase family 4 protein n=1 Tax=Delftia sp. RIT313 TaxID=1468410 RepID=UPI0004527135|nr:glycosyltransferase family 1 protein [Delftia sp. RIT313]EZP53999.1 Glycosyl transferase group 1 [Delftia sp. RIT313]